MQKATSASEFSHLAQRVRETAYWLTPSLFCLILYWHAMLSWYQQDDFIWLWQAQRLASWQDWVRAIFKPTEHGTFRPLSERLTFIIFHRLAGANPFPFHVLVFLTQFVSLVVFSAITLRLTQSRLAGFAAPILWVINSNLAFVLAWPSAYMQILCGCCLLTAFYCWLRFVESGDAFWWRLQWAPFLLGFFVMESNVVYPGLVAAHVLLFARRHARRLIPLFAVSVTFVLLHMKFAPKRAAGEYSLHFDLSVLHTLATYSKWVLLPRNYSELAGWSRAEMTAVRLVLGVALAGAALGLAWRRRFAALFFLGGFLVLLAPVLPLRDHLTDYYLTLPALGVGGAAAAAFAAAWRKSRWSKVLAAGLLVLFVGTQGKAARFTVRWWHDRSKQIETFVTSVAALRRVAPERPVVLTDLTEWAYWGCLHHRCLEALQVEGVYVAPEAAAQLADRFAGLDPSKHVPLWGVAAVPAGLAEPWVLSLDQDQLRLKENAPALARGGLPVSVELASEAARALLGKGWHPPEGNRRWMSQRASLLVPGPLQGAKSVRLSGYYPRIQSEQGPLQVIVRANNARIGDATLTQGERAFVLEFALPATAADAPELEITIEVNRTVRAEGDARELGLVFRSLQIR